MGAVSSDYPEIVDLTSQEEPVSHQANGDHTDNNYVRRRKRTMYVSLLDDTEGGDNSQSIGDDEPEIIETHSVAPPRPLNPIDSSRIRETQVSVQTQRSQPVMKSRRRVSNDDLTVVSERQITPLDRLRQIQEQHRQGKAVNLPQRSHEPNIPPSGSLPNSNAAMLYTQHLLGGPLGPMRGRLIVPPRPRGHIAARPRIWHTRAPLSAQIPLPGLPLGNLHESIEQRDYEQALVRSLEETTRRREIDRTKLNIPPAPAPAQMGFTRSLTVHEPLVCVRCDRELGKPDPGEQSLSAETKLQHNKIFVRGCGHVYCGRCTYSMKLLSPRKRGCQPQCKQVSAKKRCTFREVFI